MEQNKVESKKRLTPESTILLTVGATALVIVVYRIIRLIITGA